jgi:hypothetical protein
MRKAVVIGINDYPQAPLTASIKDAHAVASILKTNGDGSPNFDIRVYTDKEVSTKSKLTEIVYELFKGKNEIALLYFSGHGAKNELDTYLVTPDAEKYNLGLSVSDLIKMANESESWNRVIILDCCYSGALGKNNILSQNISAINKGVTILTASKSDQKAMETVNGHSVFTNLLLLALEGGAADIIGNITPGSIYSFIDRALGAHEQRPVFKTNISEFASLREVTPQVPKEILRKIPLYFPESDYFYQLNPSYEDTNVEGGEHKTLSPYATPENVAIFKELQMYQSVGLLVPINAKFMYYASMESKSCALTPLGRHYWWLAKEDKF